MNTVKCGALVSDQHQSFTRASGRGPGVGSRNICRRQQSLCVVDSSPSPLAGVSATARWSRCDRTAVISARALAPNWEKKDLLKQAAALMDDITCFRQHRCFSRYTSSPPSTAWGKHLEPKLLSVPHCHSSHPRQLGWRTNSKYQDDSA